MLESVDPKLLLYLAPMLPLAGLAFDVMAALSVGAAREEIDRWKALGKRITMHITALENARKQQPAEMETQRAAKESTSHNATPDPIVTNPLPVVLSLLEQKAAELQRWLRELLSRLEHWSRAAGVSLDDLTPVPSELKQIDAELQARHSGSLDPVQERIRSLLPDLLRSIIRKTDNDLDQSREHDALQAALKGVVDATGMSMIDPGRGAIFDARLHHSIGIFAEAGTPEQRGKVGQVRRRGILSANGEVIELAEVREYD